jgi:hypothetical protein
MSVPKATSKQTWRIYYDKPIDPFTGKSDGEIMPNKVFVSAPEVSQNGEIIQAGVFERFYNWFASQSEAVAARDKVKKYFPTIKLQVGTDRALFEEFSKNRLSINPSLEQIKK